jgi:O-antigen/teichoic acid export membrane protein
MNLTGILRRVTFPVLSVVQDDDDRLENIFRNILRVSVFTMFPLMFFLIGIAKPLIVILLTEKWLPVVLLLQILCVGMMWYPVDAINLNLLMIKGRSDIVMKLEIFKKIIGISILFITIPMGLEIMCVGFSIYSLIEILSDTYYSGKLYNIGLLKQLKDYSPSILMSFIILILTYLLSIIIANNYILLGLDILVAIGVLFVSVKIFKIEEFDLLLSFIKK